MKGKSKAKATHRFVATIYKLWMMRHVDVPDEVACVGERVGGWRNEREFQAWRSFEQEKQACANEIYSCFRYGEWTGGAGDFGAGRWRAISRAT
jgi:hypothetical protein